MSTEAKPWQRHREAFACFWILEKYGYRFGVKDNNLWYDPPEDRLAADVERQYFYVVRQQRRAILEYVKGRLPAFNSANPTLRL